MSTQNWDSVPWFTGGGAQHSAEVARLLGYAATGGAEGVVNVGDLKVVPIDVPGGSVQVLPGSALIRARSVGGDSQTYVGRLPKADVADVAQTGSDPDGRSDLVIVQIEDPNMPGEPWQQPEDVKKGPYIFTRVIPNVPPGTRRLQDVDGYQNRTAVTLARIDVPPSTAAIQASMITDLRKVAIPRQHTQRLFYSLVTGNEEKLTSKASTGEVWPNASTNSWGEVDIPEWATHADIEVQWNSVFLPPGASWGAMWLQVGGTGAGAPLVTQASRWDSPNSNGNTRMVFALADYRSIKAELRGTSQRVYPYARNDGTTPSAYPTLNASSSCQVTFTFYERAV